MDLFPRRQMWWVALWIISVLLIAIVLFSSIAVQTTPANPVSTFLMELVTGTWLEPIVITTGALAQNDGIYGISVGALFTLLSISSIYIFKIPNIRNTAIHGIAWGYYENYLSRVVEGIAKEQPNFRVIIVLPSYELVERPTYYWARLQVTIDRLGFELDKKETDAVFGRSVFSIYKQNERPLPLYVDLPSTMKVIRRILELEAHMPAGRVARQRWWRSRFKQLREEFKGALVDFFGDEGWGNLVFIEGDNSEQFARDIEAVIQELEEDIARFEAIAPGPDSDPEAG